MCSMLPSPKPGIFEPLNGRVSVLSLIHICVPQITALLTPAQLARAFDYTRQLANVDAIFERVLQEPVSI